MLDKSQLMIYIVLKITSKFHTKQHNFLFVNLKLSYLDIFHLVRLIKCLNILLEGRRSIRQV